jgi:DNA invertase Pin-like site-specific DNA recombinase
MSTETDSAVVYVRVAAGNPTSLVEDFKRQEQACRAYAERHGYKVAATYSDHASGLSSDRPGLEAMLEHLASPRPVGSVVIVSGISVLGRSPAVLASVKSKIAKAGCFVTTIAEDGAFQAGAAALTLTLGEAPRGWDQP